MLYYLHTLQDSFGPLRVFEYISVRTIGASGTAFLLCIFFGPWIIDLLRRLKIGQHVRDDEVLKRHRKKEGTPTMGGVMFIGAVFIATALWAETKNLYVWLTVATMIWMGAIGFYDDYLN